MAEKRYNLDTIVSKYIHRPIISLKSGEQLPPLYARIGTEMESSLDLAAAKNPSWLRGVNVKYNSPTNAKRLFIGDRKVYVQYFKPMFTADGKSGACWVKASVNEEDVIGNLVNKSVNYNQLLNEAMATGENKPDRVVISKTGLGAISNNWVMSNLEEVYITSEILMSEDIVTKFKDAPNIWKTLRDRPAGVMVENEIALRIFEYANGANINNIRNRFPRLRKVVLVAGLDKIMEQSGAMGINDNMPSTLEEANMSWLAYANSLGISKLGSFVVSNVPVAQGHDIIMTFALRTGIYKFDATVLQDYVDKYKERIQDLRMEKSGFSNKKDENIVTTKSEYEKYLDSLCETHSQQVVMSAIRLAFARVKMDDINATFNEMSTDGRKKYREMLGR